MTAFVLKSSDFLNFSIDHIEIFWTIKNFDTLFRGMDGDNSHIREFEWYTLEKTDKIRSYQYKITFWRDNIPVFAWYRWDQLNMYIETRDYFVAYGSAFRVHSFPEILEFIETHLNLDGSDFYKKRKHHSLKRIDLALDIKQDINDIVSRFKELKQKWSKFFDEKWLLQTYYIWEKQMRKNKALLIRIYDKIADIYQKEKQLYYPWYLKEKSVTRAELEFRSDLLKNVKLSQFLDKSFSFWLFCLYIWKHTKLFKKFENNDVEKLTRLDKRVDMDDLHHRQLTRNRYVNTFLWYAKKFLHFRWCPLDILIRENIFKEETIQDIVNCFENGKFNRWKYVDGMTQKNLKRVFADNFEKQDESYKD